MLYVKKESWHPISQREFYLYFNDFESWFNHETEFQSSPQNYSDDPPKKGRGGGTPTALELRYDNLCFMYRKFLAVRDKYIKNGSHRLPESDLNFLHNQLKIAQTGKCDF